MIERNAQVVVIGGGPAGLAAAVAADRAGADSVLLIDANVDPGGQIWRGETRRRPDQRNATAGDTLADFGTSAVLHLGESRVVAAPAPGELLVETAEDVLVVRYGSLVIATGARERFVPFPGWTRPNVMGVGGLQAMVKGGLPIEGKRVALAGSGPLLLAVADSLQAHGARIVLVAEQAPSHKVARFGMGMLMDPGKLGQGLGYAWRLRRVPYRRGWWPARADGRHRSRGDASDAPVSRAVLTNGRGQEIIVACDYLACGFHITPSLELVELLGCATEYDTYQGQRTTVVDGMQQTSVAGIYGAGECIGVGGLECALIEGRIAGLAAAGHPAEAAPLLAERDRERNRAQALNAAFSLRPELRRLADPETVVCRCEDIPLSRLVDLSSWREAKLHTRCGMGACQGRVCGGAVEFLFDWEPRSTRPPLFPARVGTLAAPRD